MSPLFFVVRLKIDAISIEVVKAMYELYERFSQRIPLVEEWQSYEPGVFVLCLLYTSPSPRDATLSRMPSSA